MSRNSMYDSLTIDSVINEIKLTLSATPNVPFLILEGDDDINFFRHHCSKDVIIRESFRGKCGVYQILKELSGEESVIGICDRDYDKLPLPTKVFSYDYSCLETMILANDKIEKIVFTQLCLKGKISLFEILKQLSWLSHLREKSFQKDLAIRFDGLPISQLFNHTFGLEKDKLIVKLRELNNNILPLDSCDIESIEAAANSGNSFEDLLFITQGHDLISLIQCYHVHFTQFKSKTMSANDIRALLYCTYVEKFNTSKIYNDILIYGKSVNITFWNA